MAIVSDPIVVVTAADEGYTMPLAVMGRSLLGSLDPGRRVHLYVIADRVRARSRRRILASWGSERLEVTWLVPDLDRLRHVFQAARRHTAAAHGRAGDLPRRRRDRRARSRPALGARSRSSSHRCRA